MNPTREIVATNVINRLACAVAKLNTIAKIRNHDKRYFIPMAMDVHGTLGCDIDRFIKECVHLFHNG